MNTNETNALIEAPAMPVGLGGGTMSPALQIMLNDKLFERAKQVAGYLAKAEGFIPRHLVGKQEACFAVVMRAITWKLDPYAVASCTYQTPGGQVGFEGKLCQAILENSGRLDGPVRYKHYGDWSKVQGKFEIKKSSKGNDYAARTWTQEDAKGLGVTVIAKVKGEQEPRTWPFDLVQAFPLNSTLWALDPKTQICYTAVRRFASVAAPGLFMGVPFDFDDTDPAARARDVTPPPRPTRDPDPAPPQDETDDAGDADPMFTLFDEEGREVGHGDYPAFFEHLKDGLVSLAGTELFEGFWEHHESELAKLDGRSKPAKDLARLYNETREAAMQDRAKAKQQEESQAKQESAADDFPGDDAGAVDIPSVAVPTIDHKPDWLGFCNAFKEAMAALPDDAARAKLIEMHGSALSNLKRQAPQYYDDLMGTEEGTLV